MKSQGEILGNRYAFLLFEDNESCKIVYKQEHLLVQKLQKRDIMYVLVYVMLTVVPFLRMVGLLVQASRGGSLVRAGCLEYRVSFNSGPGIRSLESNELDYQTHFQWDDFYMVARDEGKYFNENNATMKRFNVTPFNSQCLIAIDYLYLIGELILNRTFS